MVVVATCCLRGGWPLQHNGVGMPRPGMDPGDAWSCSSRMLQLWAMYWAKADLELERYNKRRRPKRLFLIRHGESLVRARPPREVPLGEVHN